MKKGRLSAVAAERIFLVGILALIALLVVDFIFVTKLLRQQAQEADHARIEADISDSDITNVGKADKWLSEHPDDVKRVNNVIAESKLYKYQNQIIADIQDYANATGISVSGYSFPVATAGAAPGAAPAAAAAGPAAASVAAAAGPALQTTPPGVNAVTVNITLGEGIGYFNFLHFLQLLEKNVTRMQITNISLSPDNTSPNLIASPTLTLLVYTNK